MTDKPANKILFKLYQWIIQHSVIYKQYSKQWKY